MKIKNILVAILIATIGIVGCTNLTTTTERSPAAVDGKVVVLVGLIPGEYLQRDKNSYVLGYVEIANRIIQKMEPLAPNAVDAFIQQQKTSKIVIKLLQQGAKNFDVIYPGLMNLHNHTKQNFLPTWDYAKGQFQNRFEWRAWGIYKKSVSQNMNPWIGFGKPLECAAFRWSNILNMINGTTYLQGPSSCINGFAIRQVENAGSYVSKKAGVQAPTDLILPNEMVYVWDVLKAKIEAGQTYEQALADDVLAHCPSLKGSISAETVNTAAGIKILSNQAGLKAACTTGTLHPKFIRYVYFIHKTIAGKKEYLKNPNHSAIIAHLAEGRRQDPYNMLEYKLVKLLGLNQPHVNFIHAVGLTNEDFADMKKNNMGIVWSPYSNLLLYGQTLDIVSAYKAGVTLAIGSDWVPTGSKSVLEEIKLAARYIDREKLNATFTDEVLFKMMTENPARMINHWENGNGEAGVGRLAIGSMGSVMVASALNSNPYTNLVRQVTERDVNLVVIDGFPSYGNTNYLEQAGIKNYEVFSAEIVDADKTISQVNLPKPAAATAGTEEEDDDGDAASGPVMSPFLVKFATEARKIQFNKKDLCQFASPKAFTSINTKTIEQTVDVFQKQTQIDLDKIDDIRQLLTASALTSSVNKLAPTADSANYSLNYAPSAYSCNNPRHLARIGNYIKSDGNDELKQNLADRAKYRGAKGMPSAAKNLAESYKQTYVEK